MPENDEPLDDLRAVSMTAAAAAARVVETVVRDRQERARNSPSVAPAAPAAAVAPTTAPAAVDTAPQERGEPEVGPGKWFEPGPYKGGAQQEPAAAAAQPTSQAASSAFVTEDDMHDAFRWARSQPEVIKTFNAEKDVATTSEEHWAARDKLVAAWQEATKPTADSVEQQPAAAKPEVTPTTENPAVTTAETQKPAVAEYDSPKRREATDQALQAAGVPDEARHAKVTADLLNGTNPQHAAALGSTVKAKTKTPAKASARERIR